MDGASTFPERTRYKGVYLLLLLFLALFFMAQLLSDSSPIGTSIALGGALLVLIMVLLLGSRSDMLLFLFVTTAMSITIPYTKQRELDLVLPIVFFVAAVLRFFPKLIHLRKRYFHSVLLSMGIFFIFCVIAIFNNIKIPGINAVAGENSGLFNRFNLFNSLITFLTTLILFDSRFIVQFIKDFFRFYLIVLLISIAIVAWELGQVPFFNTFSWSVIIENQESKKMIIAGVSASLVLIYVLVFLRKQRMFYPLLALSILGILISGSRTFFAVMLFVFFVLFVVRRGVLGRSLIFLALGGLVSFYLLLSPAILWVPEKYQRLVILFPPEYYTGKLAGLSASAAASSTSFRINIWTMALERIGEHPFIGNSFGAPEAEYNFQGEDVLEGFKKIPSKILYSDFMVTGSLHNTFFSIAYLFGIPALIFFLYSFTRLIWIHYQYSLVLKDRERYVAIFIVMILIHYFLSAMAGDIIFDLPFFIFFAIAIKVFLFYYRASIAGEALPTNNPLLISA